MKPIFFKMSDQKSSWSEKVPEIIRRNAFKPVTLAVIFLVLVAQVLIVQHVHQTRSPSTGIHIKPTDSPRKNVTLKPLKLDQVIGDEPMKPT